MPSATLTLLLPLHHFREHAAHSVHRSTRAFYDERKLSARVDDTIQHGTGGRARTAGCCTRHGILFRPEETDALASGLGDDAQHPRAAGHRTGSQHGDLSRQSLCRQCRRQDFHLCLAI